jgi:RNA polymerase sigma-70 factor (ECF subfamily)
MVREFRRNSLIRSKAEDEPKGSQKRVTEGGERMEDSDIVDLYFARDEKAITETQQKYGIRLRHIAYAVLGSEEAAKECENDTYHQAWNLIPPAQPRTGLFVFLGQIIRHLAIDEYRKGHAGKRNAVLVEFSKEMEECFPADVSDEWWEKYQEKELVVMINSFLESCPPWKRKLFVRRYWYLDGIADISKRYGYSQGKVRTELFRMREKLRDYLRQEGYEI